MIISELYILKIQQFLLVFFRIAGIFVISPIFGHKQIPKRIKAGLALFISFAVFPIANVGFSLFRENWWLLTLDIMSELSVGIVIGYAASILFTGIEMSGVIVSRQMGLRMAKILNPLSGEQGSPVVMFQSMVAGLLFLGLNGHHWLIIALCKSFQLAPAGNVTLTSAVPNKLVEMVGGAFSTGIRIAAPAFVILLLVTIMMGIIAKAIPQMNILIVAMPLKIGIGFIGLIISVPMFGFLFRKFYTIIQKDVMYLLQTF